VDSAADLIAALSERITQVEHQLSSQAPIIVSELKESTTNHDRQLESLLSVIEAKPAILRTEIADLRQFAQLLQTELEAMRHSLLASPVLSERSRIHYYQLHLAWRLLNKAWNK
jgi:hypothetical protein